MKNLFTESHLVFLEPVNRNYLFLEISETGRHITANITDLSQIFQRFITLRIRYSAKLISPNLTLCNL